MPSLASGSLNDGVSTTPDERNTCFDILSCSSIKNFHWQLGKSLLFICDQQIRVLEGSFYVKILFQVYFYSPILLFLSLQLADTVTDIVTNNLIIRA